MGKITDMLISAALKKGILYEARNCDLEFEVPIQQVSDDKREIKSVLVKVNVEHMTLRIEKDEIKREA